MNWLHITDGTGDNYRDTHYPVECFCWNCGKGNIIFIKKGIPKDNVLVVYGTNWNRDNEINCIHCGVLGGLKEKQGN